MPRGTVIESLPQVLRVIKEMNLSEEEDSEYREEARQALKEVLEGRMRERVSSHLLEMARLEVADRRNGSYSRHLITELGEIELSIPRTRTFSAGDVVRAYAGRGAPVERMILLCFVLGLSTRKVAEALLPILGERVSASTVSRIARSLDGAVEAFHRRPSKGAIAS